MRLNKPLQLVDRYRVWRDRRAALKEADRLRREVLDQFPCGTQSLKVDLLMYKWRKAKQIERKWEKITQEKGVNP